LRRLFVAGLEGYMHILGIMVAALAGASYWVWHLRQAKGTLDDIGDAAMRAKGA
jgi:hypothetical protein